MSRVHDMIAHYVATYTWKQKHVFSQRVILSPNCWTEIQHEVVFGQSATFLTHYARTSVLVYLCHVRAMCPHVCAKLRTNLRMCARADSPVLDLSCILAGQSPHGPIYLHIHLHMCVYAHIGTGKRPIGPENGPQRSIFARNRAILAINRLFSAFFGPFSSILACFRRKTVTLSRKTVTLTEKPLR